jgi:DNA-binding NarL/FixJ family response regulator
MKPTRLLIVDDHAVVRKGIQMIVSTEPSIEVVAETGTGQEAIRLAKSLHPDVILMDLMLPECDGIQATAEIKRTTPDIKIIILTTFGDEARVNAAMEAGADGYLLKDADDGEMLLSAIQSVQQDHLPIHPQVTRHLLRTTAASPYLNRIKHLTEREKEVLQLMATGLSNKDMAQVLNLTKGTVKIHVSHILSKLQASSRTEAVIHALEKGLIRHDKDIKNIYPGL